MSKLVEIKAEYLKWCHFGFQFNRVNLPSWEDSLMFLYFDSKYNTIKADNTCISSEIDILVDSKEYEQAVIERIKEMIPTAEEISKDDDLFEGVNEVWVMFEGLHKISRHVKVSADPRPWESEYTINLQEEDNE